MPVVVGPQFPKKGILGTEPKKNIAKFGINTAQYIFVRMFILNKAFLSFGTKFSQNRYFRDEHKKTTTEVKIRTLEHHFVLSFISNKACFWTKLAQKSILGTKFRKIKSRNVFYFKTILNNPLHNFKQSTTFWVIVGNSVNILGYCGL